MTKIKEIFTIVSLLLWGTIGLNAQSGTVTSGGEATGTGGTVSFTIGQVASITAKASSGTVRQGLQQPYEILIKITTINGSSCGPGTVTLKATAPSSTINWYSALTGGTLLQTDTIFTTPVLTATKTYYVSVVTNGYTSSPRTAVKATINAIPSITGTTPKSRCGPGTISLSAKTSAGIIIWYDALTGGVPLDTGTTFITPVLSATKTYYVQANNNGCLDTGRTAITATVKPIPYITGTTPDTICGPGVAMLGASCSSGDVRWYSSASGGIALDTGFTFTTPLITLTKTYYVTANENGCYSTPRTAVKAILYSIPTFTSLTPASRCGQGTVSLKATPSAGLAIWYDSLSGGVPLDTGTTFITPVLSATKTYYVQANNNGCLDTGRTAITATVKPIPYITGTTPDTICGTGVAMLGATCSSGDVRWYAASSGGIALDTGFTFTTPLITITKTFYVTANENGCYSTPRTAVKAILYSIPTFTSLTPASRCGQGIVTLKVKPSTGLAIWYDLLTGGVPLDTGTSFITPVLTATKTYYVEGNNNGCLSTARSAITATIKTIPSVTGTVPASRCGPGSVTLGASGSFGDIRWYAASSGGTALDTSTVFTTPSLTATKTYYISANDNGCSSSPRTTVVATLFTIPTIKTTTPASRCGGGILTLKATASAGLVIWYDSLTGGTALDTGTSYITPSLSSTRDFYVASSSNGCISVARSAVTATIKTIPSITSTTPASRLGPGYVTLYATASSGTVKWYSVLVGGSVLASGDSFTTPTLSVTKTYYVDATDNLCTSVPRSGVTATILPILIPEIILTGINDNTDNLEVKYYPNPASDILNLQIKGLQSTATLAITDLSGRVMLTKQIESSGSVIYDQIYIKELAKGVYYLTLKNEKVYRGGKMVKY